METEEKIVLDQEQQEVYNAVCEQNRNVFIQGQAGTGKSTLINYIRHNTTKNVLVACPTAVAATVIGGSTLHSLFRLPPKDYFQPEEVVVKRNRSQDILFKYIDMLIIDEVSMVRPDMLDAIDLLLKVVRNKKLPFGGVQVVLVGDLYQLPPVIKNDVRSIFQEKYNNGAPRFFDSNAYKKGNFEKFELTIVHRQEDLELLENLKNIRSGKNLWKTLDFFNHAPKSAQSFKDAVIITPYKKRAEEINISKLAEIDSEEKTYGAKVTGNFKTASDTPAPLELTLKVGALVMFNKNDKEKQWINGSTGIVKKLNKRTIEVELTNSGYTVCVHKDVWNLIKYTYDKALDKVVEENVGSFEQFPLQLGYAVTIHKAQSKTLDKVIIDTDRGIFAPGQLYVALSRTRRLCDMLLKTTLNLNDIRIDNRIDQFLTQNEI